MHRAALAAACLLLSCSSPRPAPDNPGAPSGPRPLSELQALIGDSSLALKRTVSFGFESQDEFSAFYRTPVPHLGTTRQELSPDAFAGKLAHHAWIEGPNAVVAGQNTNHRGYPTIQFQKTAGGPLQGVVLIEFMAWLNIALEHRENASWFSFITVTSYADDLWERTMLFNLDDDGRASLMHVPGQQQRTIDLLQRDDAFPLRQWVKLSMLLDFTSANDVGAPYLKVWVNEQPVSSARFNPRIDPLTVDKARWPPCLAGWNEQDVRDAETLCGLEYVGGVTQVHLGMYAPPLLMSGDVYNDELYFYELARP